MVRVCYCSNRSDSTSSSRNCESCSKEMITYRHHTIYSDNHLHQYHHPYHKKPPSSSSFHACCPTTRYVSDLRDGIRRCHVGVLERTIEEAENSQFSGQLQNQIEAARQKLAHLKVRLFCLPVCLIIGLFVSCLVCLFHSVVCPFTHSLSHPLIFVPFSLFVFLFLFVFFFFFFLLVGGLLSFLLSVLLSFFLSLFLSFFTLCLP